MPDSEIIAEPDGSDTPTCRLYVILARESPTSVIFRRGPSRWVEVIKWDTSTDTFMHGQWFHGRIYEKRCDLSPDGSLLIYFAQKINRHTVASDYSYAWTAISKLPYLTALALWPKGDCWDGGGLFSSNYEIWLNHPPARITPHPNHEPTNLKITHNEGRVGEDEPILMRRLVRDGWRLTQEWQVEYTRSNRGFVTHAPQILRKQNPLGWQKLTMSTAVEGFRRVSDHFVRYAEGKDRHLTGARWADWDRRGRLVYAREGRLYVASFADDETQDVMLADFNEDKPGTAKAPEWAKKW